MEQPHFDIYYLSESAVTLQFGHQISDGVHDRVSRFDQILHQHPFRGYNTTVPAYTTLTVFYDPMLVYSSDLPGEGCFEKVSNYLKSLKLENYTSTTTKATINIPVCYGGDHGPDIDEVANTNGLTVDDVIQLHSEAAYKVYMIGFVPGFAYLGGMDPKIATPRKGTPRKAVLAGSIGIAGEQTGIYPLQTPGGWQIIGRTSLTLFDAYRDQPSLLKAGDEVIFKPITTEEFDHLSQQIP